LKGIPTRQPIINRQHRLRIHTPFTSIYAASFHQVSYPGDVPQIRLVATPGPPTCITTWPTGPSNRRLPLHNSSHTALRWPPATQTVLEYTFPDVMSARPTLSARLSGLPTRLKSGNGTASGWSSAANSRSSSPRRSPKDKMADPKLSGLVLRVAVVKGRELAAKDRGGTSDPVHRMPELTEGATIIVHEAIS
jgi:hypothetical protein